MAGQNPWTAALLAGFLTMGLAGCEAQREEGGDSNREGHTGSTANEPGSGSDRFVGGQESETERQVVPNEASGMGGNAVQSGNTGDPARAGLNTSPQGSSVGTDRPSGFSNEGRDAYSAGGIQGAPGSGAVSPNKPPATQKR